MTRALFLALVATLSLVLVLAVGCGPSTTAQPTPTAQRTPTSSAAPTTAAGSPSAQATPSMSASPSQSAAGNVQNGQAVFNTNCNACHPGGKQGVGPAITGVPDQQIVTTVRNGKGSMPAFGPDKISDQQVQDLLAYIHTLR